MGWTHLPTDTKYTNADVDERMRRDWAWPSPHATFRVEASYTRAGQWFGLIHATPTDGRDPIVFVNEVIWEATHDQFSYKDIGHPAHSLGEPAPAVFVDQATSHPLFHTDPNGQAWLDRIADHRARTNRLRRARANGTPVTFDVNGHYTVTATYHKTYRCWTYTENGHLCGVPRRYARARFVVL